MRHVNYDKIRFWLSQNGSLAKEDLASKSRIKFFTLGRIIDGAKMPNELEQLALCKAMDMDMDELFPHTKQEKSAS